jgi:hypothetical protein
VLLIGYGFALATVARLLYVTGSEGYRSWIGALLFLVPTGVIGLASALLVLARKPLGARLAYPFCVLLTATALVLLLEAPPLGTLLGDYEEARLRRGVTVPEYLAEGGTSPEAYAASDVDSIRLQGVLGSIAVAAVYGATVLRGARTRRRQEFGH